MFHVISPSKPQIKTTMRYHYTTIKMDIQVVYVKELKPVLMLNKYYSSRCEK